jgi:hypothetical protein
VLHREQGVGAPVQFAQEISQAVQFEPEEKVALGQRLRQSEKYQKVLLLQE